MNIVTTLDVLYVQHQLVSQLWSERPLLVFELNKLTGATISDCDQAISQTIENKILRYGETGRLYKTPKGGELADMFGICCHGSRDG